MTIRTDMDKSGETRLAARKRDNASSGIWARLKESLAVGALVLAAGCGGAAVQGQPTMPAAPEAACTEQRQESTRTQNVAFVSAEGITSERIRSRDDWEEGMPSTIRFTANQIWVTPQVGREMPLPDFEASNGMLNLTYYWFMFQDVQPNMGPLLLNPQYRDSDAPRYTGMLLRGVTTTDGQTGDFVVRVRRVDLASHSMEWAPVMEQDGHVRPENVVFQVGTNTLIPMRDSRLESSIDSAAFARLTPEQTILEFGQTTPVVVVTLARKMGCAAAAQAASTAQLAPHE